MVPSTPPRSNETTEYNSTATHTRPQDLSSPSNLDQHSKRRKQSVALNVRPPPLAIGHGARISNIASSAITSQLEEADRPAKLRRKVWAEFATAAHSVVDQQKEPEARRYAAELARGLIPVTLRW